VAVIAVAAPFALASVANPLPLLVNYGDGWAHLTAVRRTIDLGPFPGDLFIPARPSPPYYSLSHLVFAAVSLATGVPPHEILLASAPLAVALIVAAVFLWAREITGDTCAGLAAAAIEPLVSMPAAPWQAAVFPRSLALVPASLAWLAYLRGRTGRRWPWLAAAAVLLGLCLATHLFTGGLCVIGLVLHEAALARRPSLRSLLAVLAGGVAVASPWLASFVLAGREGGEAHVVFTAARASWAPFAAYPRLRVLGFDFFTAALPPLLWAAVALGAFRAAHRWRRGGAGLGDRFALLASLTGLALVFTPLFSFAVAAFGVWAGRLALVVPLSLLAGLGVAWLAGGLRARGPLRAGCAAILVAITASAGHALWSNATQHREFGAALRRQGPLGDWSFGADLARLGPLPRVILSDPQTSYLLPYFLGSYVVVMPVAHGSPYVAHGARERDARRFYSPRTKASELYEILDRYGADAVAVSTATWPDAASREALLLRLRKMPGFEETGCCGTVRFFRYRGAGATRGRGGAR